MSTRSRNLLVVSVGVLIGVPVCLMGLAMLITGMRGEAGFSFIGTAALFIISGFAALKPTWRRVAPWTLLMLGVLAFVVAIRTAPNLRAVSAEGFPAYFFGVYWLAGIYGLALGVAMLLMRRNSAKRSEAH